MKPILTCFLASVLTLSAQTGLPGVVAPQTTSLTVEDILTKDLKPSVAELKATEAKAAATAKAEADTKAAADAKAEADAKAAADKAAAADPKAPKPKTPKAVKPTPPPKASKPAMGLVLIPSDDYQAVIKATAFLLQKHITFRADGTCSAYSAISDKRQSLEWLNFKIKLISAMPITPAEKTSGVEKRYYATVISDNTRHWDYKTKGWTPWTTMTHALFPSGITVEWKNGEITATGGENLKKFTPGPGPGIGQAGSNKPIQSDNGGLPPGMSRAK